jgi:hypothetical protein
LVALIALPTLVVAAQPYNGEGVLRAYLFALPWLAFLGAEACRPLAAGVVVGAAGRLAAARAVLFRWRSTALTAGATAIATTVIGATGVIGSFGRELVNQITPQDISIERWYELHAPAGSVAFYLAPNVPNRITYRYARDQVWAGSFSPSALDYPFLLGHQLGLADVPALVRLLRGYHATRSYVLITPSEIAYVDAVGAFPPGTVTAFEAALDASGQFRLVAGYGSGRIYQLL